MTIWLIILPFGVATFAMRGAFLLCPLPAGHSPDWQRWLRYVTPSILAALVLPALVVVGQPLAPDTLRQLLAAGLAALVAWRFQNVLATVASGMAALWGLTWLPDTTLTVSLPLSLLLLVSVCLLLLFLGSALAWVRLRRRARQHRREATQPSSEVTVSPREDRLLPAETMSLRVRKPLGAHLHCPWCWCPLPAWALYCGHCGLPQQAPALAITQPLAAITVTPERSERLSAAIGVHAERATSLPRLAGAHSAKPARGQHAQKGDA